MKRAIFLLTVLAVLSVGPAALAQVRDPFDPLVVPGTETGAVTAPEDGAVQPVDAVGEVPSDRLADTGFDPASYLAVAYALLVFGAGAIYLARLRLQPTR